MVDWFPDLFTRRDVSDLVSVFFQKRELWSVEDQRGGRLCIRLFLDDLPIMQMATEKLRQIFVGDHFDVAVFWTDQGFGPHCDGSVPGGKQMVLPLVNGTNGPAGTVLYHQHNRGHDPIHISRSSNHGFFIAQDRIEDRLTNASDGLSEEQRVPWEIGTAFRFPSSQLHGSIPFSKDGQFKMWFALTEGRVPSG